MLNLGTLQFGLAVNTQALDNALTRLESFKRSVTAVQNASNRGSETAIAQLRRQENAVTASLEKVKTFADRVNNLKIAPSVRTDLIERAQRAFAELSKKASDASRPLDATQFDRTISKFRSEIASLGREMRNTPTIPADTTTKLIAQARAAEAAAARYADLNRAMNQGGSGKSASASASVFSAAFKAEDALNYARATEQASAAQARFNATLAGTANLANKSASASAQVFAAAFNDAGKSEAALLRQANAYERVAERVRNLDAQVRNSKLNVEASTSLSDKLGAVSNMAKGSLTAKSLNPQEFSSAQVQINRALGEIRREFNSLRSTAEKVPSSFEQMQKALRSMGASALLLNGHLGGMSTRLFALSSIVGSFGLAAGAAAGALGAFGLGALNLGKGAIDVTLKMEKAEKALTAITGSAAAASVEIAKVASISNQAGVVFTETTGAFARYTASANAAGQSAGETERQFRAVALAAGTMGLSADDTNGVFRALEQIMSKGAVQSEELRGQLGDRLPGAFAIAAAGMGKTTAELQKMMKAGDVLSSDFLPKFTDALTKAYNIDVTKNIDTLQATINRLTNSSDQFYASFGKNTGVVNIYREALKGLTSLLNMVTENLAGIIRTSVGVVGAIAGMTAAFVAIRVAMLAWAGTTFVIAWMGSFIALARTATSATQMWALAQVALNTAMLANPIGAIAALLARLTVGIAAAVFGYKTLTGAIDESNRAAADTSGFDAYIQTQIAMKSQIKATTLEMINQAVTMARTSAMNMRSTATDIRRQEVEVSRLRDQATKDRAAVSNNGGKAATENYGLSGSALGAAERRLNELRQLEAAYSAEAQSIERTLGGLNRVAELPEMGSPTAGVTTEDAGKKKKGVEDNISALEDLIRAAQSAEEKMTKLASGPVELQNVDDWMKAKDILRDFSQTELVMAEAAMRAAGLSTGDLTTDVAMLAMGLRKTEESIDAFIKAWEGIDSAGQSIKDVREQIDYLQAGGDAANLYLVENAAKAREALKGLGDKELTALVERLRTMGYEGSSAAEALTKLFNADSEANQLLSSLTEMRDAMREVNQTIYEANAAAAGYAISEETGKEVEKLLERNRAMADYRALLEGTGMSDTEKAAAVQQYATALDAAATATDRLAKAQAAAEAFKQMWRDIKSDAINNIMDVIHGVENLQRAIIDTFMNIVDRITEISLDKAFDSILNSVTGGKKDPTSDAAAIVSNTAAITTHSAALAGLTSATAAATAALYGLSTSAGGTNSPGGGILGAILGGATSIFGASQGLGSSAFNGAGSIKLPDYTFGRAAGGPVSVGQIVRMNEPGAGQELWAPSTSGAVINPRDLMGSGTTVHMVNRTTIDARGATLETVEELKREMRRRDDRIKREMGPIIDARLVDNAMRGRVTS